MSVIFGNLDGGYEQLSGMNNLIKSEGKSLLDAMSNNINNLKKHWIGSDATVHINNLIKVHSALSEIVTKGSSITSSVADQVIAVQMVRRANDAIIDAVGSALEKFTENVGDILQVEDTQEYNCDPAARTDYEELEKECEQFANFVEKFVDQKQKLFENWKDGADRQTAKTAFEKFEEHAEEYKGFLEKAKTNLGIAVDNIATIQ